MNPYYPQENPMFKRTRFLIDAVINHRAQMIEEIRHDFSSKKK